MAVGALATAAVDVVANLDTFEPDLVRKLESAIRNVSKTVEKDFDKMGGRAGKKFSDAVSKTVQAGKPFDSVGDSAERAERTVVAATRGMSDGFKLPLDDVQKLERAVQSASDSQADAIGKVRVAETLLAEARKKSGEESSQAIAAEERLAAAQRLAARDSKRLLDVTESLVSAREAAFRKAGEAAGEAAGDGFGDGFRKTARGSADDGGREAGGFFAQAFETAASRAIGTGMLRLFAAGVASLVVAASPLSTVLSGGAAAVVAFASALVVASGSAVSLLGVLGSLGLAAGALKVGFTGVGDAMKLQSKAQEELAVTGKVSTATQEKLDAALKQLSPSAAAVVKQLGAMAPAWQAVARSVQERLFTNVAATIQTLANRYLPILTTQLGVAATTLNRAGVGLAQFLSTTGRSSQITTIFSGLNKILATLLIPLRTVTAGFLDLFTASLPFAQKLADALSNIGLRFGEWLSRVTTSGAFNNFMETAMTLAGDLFDLLGNIGSILGSVFGAGAATGGHLLAILADLTESLAQFLKTPAGQAALASFFNLIAQAGKILVGVFETLSPLLSGIGALFDAMGPALQALGTALIPVIAQLSAGLGAALTQLAPLFAQLVVAITPLVQVIGSVLVTQFTNLVPVIVALVQGLIPLVTAIVTGLVPAFTALLPLSAQLAPLMVQLVQAFVAGFLPVVQALVPILPFLVAAIVQLVQAFLPLIPAVLPLVAPMSQLSLALAQMLVALTPLLPLIVQMGTDIAGVLIPAVVAVVPYMIQMVATMTTIVTVATRVIAIVVRLAIQVQTSFNTMRDGAIAAISSMASGVVGFFSSMISTVTGLLTGFHSVTVQIAYRIAIGILAAIRSGLSGLPAAFRAPFDAARAGVAAALNGIISVVSAAVGRIQSLVSTITGALGKIRLPGGLGGIDIPGLAKGAIVDRPTLAMVGEGKSREAVIPLDGSQRSADLMDQSGLTAMALERALSKNSPDGGSGRVREINMPVTVAGLTKDETVQLFREFLRNMFGPRLGLATAEGGV